MGKLNQITCGVAEGANTGVGDCPYQLKNFLGGFLTPAGFKIPQSTLEDPALLYTFLKNATMAPKGERIYPIHGFKGLPTDNTQQDAGQTFGYGEIVKMSEGDYMPTYQIYDGGVCLQKNLRKFNGAKNLGFIFYDSAFVLLGTLAKEAGASFLQAIPLKQFFAQKIGLPTTPNEAARYLIDFTFAVQYINDNPAFVETKGFDVTSVTGLQDVVLTLTNKAASAIDVSAVTSCGALNLYELAADELTEETAWVLKDSATGAALVLTSVAKNDSAQTWTITTTDPLPAAFTVQWASPDILAGAPINLEGYESLVAKFPAS